jgi:hypothetical protein
MWARRIFEFGGDPVPGEPCEQIDPTLLTEE